jgi:enoyl-[acyl-carrier protein] reductase III
VSICVTGGSSGIGRAIAERFATEGNDVFINYHVDDSSAQEAAASVRRAGARPHLVKADIGTEGGIAQLISVVSQEVAHLDQLVHAAASAVSGPLLDQSWNDVIDSVAVNGVALVMLVKEALPLLDGGSSVVYITSQGSRSAIPHYGTLGVGKALGEQAVRYLAAEVGRRDIRVNAVSPGPLDTTAFRTMFPNAWESILETAAKSNPAGRGLEFSDVVDVVEMLARPEFAMVRGQVITIDGGLSLGR